jgi:hypothetical protein
LIGYTNISWGDNFDIRKSILGYIFSLGNDTISWSTKKQIIITLSIYKAETIRQTQTIKKAIWLRRLIEEINPTDLIHPTIFIVITMALSR